MATEWRLGQTSAAYETSGRGPGMISTGKGDNGGVSYGTYQFSSKKGSVQEFLNQSSYKDDFSGLRPVTPEFNAKWRELAKSDPEFGRAQHDFIKGKYYDVQMARLRERGIDLSDRGPAVQDALWSTSVQFRNLTPGIFEKGIQEKFGQDFKLSELSDKDIVEAVQDYKINHNQELFRSSPTWWPGLLKRAHNEKADLIELASQERSAVQQENREVQSAQSNGPGERESATLKLGARGAEVWGLQTALAKLGYTGIDGQPLKADRDFGSNTDHAVRAFQKAHGLEPVDGKVGDDARAALARAAQRPLVSETTHPNHGLYTAIGAQLPSGSDPKVIANVTLQAMENGITSEQKLARMAVSATDAYLIGGIPGDRAKVDLTAPTPDLQAMSDHMREQTQQQVQQQRSQSQAMSI